MNGIGPFQATADQIARLREAFTPLVNELLVRESARVHLSGPEVRVNSKEELKDGGVDAHLTAAVGTEWIPAGDSAWQFKRGDLEPAACKKELRGAAWAQELLGAGAHYRLVIGVARSDQMIANRKKALVEEAAALDLIDEDDGRIEVLDANMLARWISTFPGLVVHPIMGGPAQELRDYDTWSQSISHQSLWTPTDARSGAIADVKAILRAEDRFEVRIEGPSGIGKTRLVMQALKETGVEPLAAYLPNGESAAGAVLNYLTARNRTAVVVADDCSRATHKQMAESITVGSSTKLITIGPEEDVAIRTPILLVAEMSVEDLGKYLENNFPQMGSEARRFVAEHSAGNVGFAMILADRVTEIGEAAAAELLQQGDLRGIARGLVEGGRPFYLATVLSLIERVGWDEDLRGQLELLASFAGATVEEFDELGRELEAGSILVRHGRYRAIEPHPLAVVLAAEAWARESRRIIDELLPELPRDMALSLFRRAADLGRYEPARSVLRSLMTPDGPFGSLELIESDGLGPFLSYLAIIAPEDTVEHLGQLIDEATLEQLRGYGESRRDLVWALEKLAWHTRTFRPAADALLRLALAEIESFSNNATGTWVALFGAGLPTTAASPEERLSYLHEHALSENPQIRRLVVQACSRPLGAHEVAGVSGELQQGALVEPRGGVKTFGERAEYRAKVISILQMLAEDHESGVATAASEALIDAVLPLIDDPLPKDFLIQALKGFRGAALGRLRKEIQHLMALIGRRDDPTLREGLEDLVRALPSQEPLEELRTLADLPYWDLDEESRRDQFDALAGEAIGEGFSETILSWLNEGELGGAWFVGRALARAHGANDGVFRALVDAADQNVSALAGYLHELTEAGDGTAFDGFLDGSVAVGLNASQRLQLTVAGPVSDRAKARAFELVEGLPVTEGVRGLFGWHDKLNEDDFLQLLGTWMRRVDTQEGYNAVIDWLSLWSHGPRDIPQAARPDVLTLLLRRLDYPDLGNERWDWSQVARRYVEDHPKELAKIVLALVSEKDAILLESDEESELLREAAAQAPEDVWDELIGRVVAGDWRIAMTMRGWLSRAFPPEVIVEWVGDSDERARTVAEMVDPGNEQPSEVGRFLLERFGDDEHVGSALAAEFVSGSFVGEESHRLSTLIDRLTGWRASSEPAGVRTWAARMISNLEKQREQALQREAERGW